MARFVTNFAAMAAITFFLNSPAVFADEKADADAVAVAKAKAKAILVLKSKPVVGIQPFASVEQGIAEATKLGKPAYIWVGKFRSDIANLLPSGVHVSVEEYHGVTEPHLVIKMHGGEYQFEQSKLDKDRVDLVRKIVSPMGQRSGLDVPPVVESSRSQSIARVVQTVEPPLLCSPWCRCTAGNTCGCTIGRPCQCVGPALPAQAESASIQSFFE